MTDAQWKKLLDIIEGGIHDPLPTGFVIDCPWLPNWYGRRILDYFSSDRIWLEANLKALNDFPDVMFLPGFWSEYGMCTEPSAFGARCTLPPDEFPHAHKVIETEGDIDKLPVPNPSTDGLLPFMLAMGIRSAHATGISTAMAIKTMMMKSAPIFVLTIFLDHILTTL